MNYTLKELEELTWYELQSLCSKYGVIHPQMFGRERLIQILMNINILFNVKRKQDND